MMFKEPNIDPALLAKVSAPTLVLAGDHDLIRTEHIVEIYTHLPNAQLAIFPDSTHMVPFDNPELFNGTIERFLATPFVKKDRIPGRHEVATRSCRRDSPSSLVRVEGIAGEEGLIRTRSRGVRRSRSPSPVHALGPTRVHRPAQTRACPRYSSRVGISSRRSPRSRVRTRPSSPTTNGLRVAHASSHLRRRLARIFADTLLGPGTLTAVGVGANEMGNRYRAVLVLRRAVWKHPG